MTDWRSSPLDDGHDLSVFACGVDGLDHWLREQALRAQRSDTARTYVWSSPGSPMAVAYYAITPTQVHRDELDPVDPDCGRALPAYLLARLALDRSMHGQGLGAQLLLDAVERITQAAEATNGRLIVADAMDEDAASFYAHFDFQPILGNLHRLVMKVATARLALAC